MIKFCLECGAEFDNTSHPTKKWCSYECSLAYAKRIRHEKAINRAHSRSCFHCGTKIKLPYKLCDNCRNILVNRLIEKSLNLS